MHCYDPDFPDTHDLQRSSTASGWPVLLALILVVLVLLDGLMSLADGRTSDIVQRQVDITGSRNLAALFTAGVLALVAGWAAAIARSLRPEIAFWGWLLVAMGAGALAINEVFALRSYLPSVSLLVPVVAIPMFAFMFEQLRSVRKARPFLLAALLLILSNPGTEHIKNVIVGSPVNYIYVPSEGTYVLVSEAALRLWVAACLQEVTEVLGLICLIVTMRLKHATTTSRFRTPVARKPETIRR